MTEGSSHAPLVYRSRRILFRRGDFSTEGSAILGIDRALIGDTIILTPDLGYRYSEGEKEQSAQVAST
jgi:hypothetical protein